MFFWLLVKDRLSTKHSKEKEHVVGGLLPQRVTIVGSTTYKVGGVLTYQASLLGRIGPKGLICCQLRWTRDHVERRLVVASPAGFKPTPENSVDTTGSNNWYRSQYPRSEI